jgi:hypothetical protein
MQSMTVFLLELSLGGVHLTMKRSFITASVDKLMRWLQSMMVNDAVSERAYQILLKVLNKHDPTAHVNTSEHVVGTPAQSYPPRPQDVLRAAPRNNTEQASAFNLPPATYDSIMDDPSTLYEQAIWPDNVFNSDFYSQANNGNFDLNSLSDYFQGPIEAGPAQMPMHYGSSYTSDFDHCMDWDLYSTENWAGPSKRQ